MTRLWCRTGTGKKNLRLTRTKPLLENANEKALPRRLTRTVFHVVTLFGRCYPWPLPEAAAVASFALPMLFGIVVGTSFVYF